MIARWLAALRRWWNRRCARKLLASAPARGVSDVTLVLPAPPKRTQLCDEIKLSALPPPPADFGVAQPRKLRIDGAFRTPPELDLPTPPRPPPVRRVRPRTPLGRAPLSRFTPRNFRLDASGAPANERILSVDRARDESWVLPEFRRQYVDLPWMARERVAFLGPTQAEWFRMWWDQALREKLGPGEPSDWSRPDEVQWALEVCKEQLLIRRDVVKDERPPAQQEFTAEEMEHPIAAWEAMTVAQTVPLKEWVSVADPRELAPGPFVERGAREAYLQWRTLMDALGER